MKSLSFLNSSAFQWLEQFLAPSWNANWAMNGFLSIFFNGQQVKFPTVSFFLYCPLFNSNFKPIRGKQNASDRPQKIFEIFHFASCKQSNFSNTAFATDGNHHLAPSPCAALVRRCMQGIPCKPTTSYSVTYSMILCNKNWDSWREIFLRYPLFNDWLDIASEKWWAISFNLPFPPPCIPLFHILNWLCVEP